MNSKSLNSIRTTLGKKYPRKTPPEKGLLLRHGIDADDIEWRFKKLRLLLRDAFIEYRDAAIRLQYLFDDKSLSSRKKLKASEYQIKKEYRNDPKTKVKCIPQKVLTNKIKMLDVRQEKALDGLLICKAPLVEVILHFDRELKFHEKDHEFNYPFSSITARARLIAMWVNWFFRMKYSIESNYKPEQIRKLIDGSYEKKKKKGTDTLPK